MKYKAFKQKLSIALAAMMIMASASTVSFAAGFSDLSQASWAKATIEEWTQKGLVSGYPDGTFRPSNHITRAEFATLVQKAFDLKSEAKSGFSWSVFIFCNFFTKPLACIPSRHCIIRYIFY